MRLSRTGALLVIVGAYLVLRLAVPMIRPGQIDIRLAILLSIGIMMLIQLALVSAIAGLKLHAMRSLLLAVSTGALFGLTIAVLPRFRPALDESALMILGIPQDLLLMLFAAFLGVFISFIIREPNLMLPIAVFAGLVDLWTVTVGPLALMIENTPAVVEAAAVQMPTPVPGIPGVMIGMGDFVFLAIFFSVIYRFGMNARRTFWLGYVLLTLSMFVVMALGVPIPALLPMGAAVLVANIGCFKLSHKELLAAMYVGAVLLLLLAGSAFMLLRK